MDDIEKKRTSFVKHVLRQASLRWPARNDALKAARVERGFYQCATCKDRFKREQVHLDHIEPVVSVKEGYTDLMSWINRLLVDVDGFQVLCEQCHSQKTFCEDTLRAHYNQERKKIAKEEEKTRKKLEKEQKKLDKK